MTMFAVQCFLSTAAEAQEVRKALRDYRDDRVFNYQPNDPWYRGKLFNTHTGHYGNFYNCDNEECKRNSPYICWKPHYEKDFPTRRGFWQTVKCDFAEAMQRVRDGAGECLGSADCGCSQCQTAPLPASTCNCPECGGGAVVAPASGQWLSQSQRLTQPHPQRILQAARDAGGEMNTEIGLVSGKILGNTQRVSEAQSTNRVMDSNAPTGVRVSNKRLLDRYIESAKRR